MKRASMAGVLLLSAAVAACGGRDERNDATAKSVEAPPAATVATGCLTANGDRFVLTNLERGTQIADAQPATQTYQLVGADDQLRQHVGKQVRVNGEAEAARVAEVHETTLPPASGTAGAAGTTGQQPAKPQEPSVTTETETRVEVATFRVQSVTPTGDTCAAETTLPDQRPRQ